MQKKTHDEFIRDFESLGKSGKVIGIYQNAITKIEFECENGHRWFATPNKILNGRWCPICKRNCTSQKNRKTHLQFTKQFMAKFPNGKIIGKYGKNNNTKIEFECENGHRWFATPSNILSGKWCKKCRLEQTGHNRRKTHEQFIMEFKSLYPDGELLGVYVKSSEKIKVKCKQGHIWESTPNNLLRGYWCYDCNQVGIYNKEYFEKFPERKNKNALLYFVEYLDNVNFYKIGITTRNKLSTRLRNINRYNIIYMKDMSLYDAWKTEQEIKQLLLKWKYKPDLLKGNGSTECFSTDVDIKILEDYFT